MGGLQMWKRNTGNTDETDVVCGFTKPNNGMTSDSTKLKCKKYAKCIKMYKLLKINVLRSVKWLISVNKCA